MAEKEPRQGKGVEKRERDIVWEVEKKSYRNKKQHPREGGRRPKGTCRSHARDRQSNCKRRSQTKKTKESFQRQKKSLRKRPTYYEKSQNGGEQDIRWGKVC